MSDLRERGRRGGMSGMDRYNQSIEVYGLEGNTRVRLYFYHVSLWYECEVQLAQRVRHTVMNNHLLD